MADKEVEKTNETEVTKDVRDTDDVKSVRGNNPPWALIAMGIVGTVVVLALVIGGWAFIRSRAEDSIANRFGDLSQNGQVGGRQGFRNGGGMRGGGGMIGIGATRGVVTAINGDTLTVSGGGKQVTVKKTSTTTISGDKTSVAVNDTVVVAGDTASDGTVTATQIMIRNQSFDGTSSDSQDNGAVVPST
ncbi:MAG: hypothetical protein JWN75_466 [Candidatus Saccharibacteria bacterium]|nr:hypothetical protein [Candidatus Saccharibacteria bacterium]